MLACTYLRFVATVPRGEPYKATMEVLSENGCVSRPLMKMLRWIAARTCRPCLPGTAAWISLPHIFDQLLFDRLSPRVGHHFRAKKFRPREVPFSCLHLGAERRIFGRR